MATTEVPEDPFQPNNWGRWGSDDERGALNLITPEKIKRALAIPSQGRVFQLGQIVVGAAQHSLFPVPVSPIGAQPIHVVSPTGGDWAPLPAGEHHEGMGADEVAKSFGVTADGVGYCEDYLTIRMHANATHVDALGHVWRDSQMYNGFRSEHVVSTGMRRLGIENLGAVVTRGILLDIAALNGVERLAASHTITTEELVAACERAGVELEAGDAVVLRTGWASRYFEDKEEWLQKTPGIDARSALWLAQRDVALVGSDTHRLEVYPFAPDGPKAPAHVVLLRNHGIHIIEMLVLEELSKAGAGEFLFNLIVLPVRGGTGCPVNPLAII